ncbi:MAG: flagellar hook-basal body protein [Actinomycetota bacterium]|nr:flagellar hook-basal body protein [Actinomycetota bacterium]
MLEGLYSAAAGMAAQQQRMDALAGDLANVNTHGYKRQRIGFRDLFYQPAARGSRPGVTTGTGAAAMSVGRSAVQGALRRTDEPLDVAIVGQGFFRVRGPGGVERLTRDGSFHLGANGDLLTASGHSVGVRVPRGTDPGDLRIGRDGRVSAGGRQLGRLDVVTVRSPDGLAAAGDNLFAPTPQSGPAVALLTPIQVEQGALEASNVDLSDAMVDMMDAQRSFQLASKAIQMQDQMMEIANGVKR